jgi:hypothetical protein
MKVEPSVTQTAADGLIQAEERQFLVEYRGIIQAAIQSKEQESEGNAELKARIAAIQSDIESLEARLDPLNDDEFQKLESQVSTKKRQLTLMEERLESDSGRVSIPLAFDGLRKTLYNCLERRRTASHQQFMNLLESFMTRPTAEYVSGLSEKNNLFVRFISSRISLCYNSSPRDARLLIETIDNLLDGKELFQFPPQ